MISTQSLKRLLSDESNTLKQFIFSAIPDSSPKVIQHPDFSEACFSASAPIRNEKILINKLDHAISGILNAEKEIRDPNADPAVYPTQHDYLQLPIMIHEIYPHAASAVEILTCWSDFFFPETPEYTAVTAVKNGCPLLKLGSFQTVPDDHLVTIERSLAWALFYAGDPQKTAFKAYQDASLTANAPVAEAAAFVAVAIALSFICPPKEAIRASLYGMPPSFFNQVNDLGAQVITPRRKPIVHCALLYSVMMNSNSVQDCFRQLKYYHAEAFAFYAAGAMFGANSSDAPMTKDTQLTGTYHSNASVSRQDLVERYAAHHLELYSNKLPWK